MKKPSKKDIRAAVEALKDKPVTESKFVQKVGKLTPKHSSERIRKQGI